MVNKGIKVASNMYNPVGLWSIKEGFLTIVSGWRIYLTCPLRLIWWFPLLLAKGLSCLCRLVGFILVVPGFLFLL